MFGTALNYIEMENIITKKKGFTLFLNETFPGNVNNSHLVI